MVTRYYSLSAPGRGTVVISHTSASVELEEAYIIEVRRVLGTRIPFVMLTRLSAEEVFRLRGQEALSWPTWGTLFDYGQIILPIYTS